MSPLDAILSAMSEHPVTVAIGATVVNWSCPCGAGGSGRGADGIAMTQHDGDAHQAGAILRAINAARPPDNTIVADDGSPFWRVVDTDTETCSGVAPRCAQQNVPGGAHDIDGAGSAGDGYDSTGVFDCCPGPHLETWGEASAHLLMVTLNRNNVRLCT